MLDFLHPPEYDNIERNQKARFLHFSLLIAAVACISLGVLNLPGGSNLDLFLFLAGILCVLCIPLNKRGYYTPVALFTAGLMLLLITYSLIAGVGLKDAGLIAYPIFIIFGSYLFGKRSVFYTMLLSIGSVTLVFYLETEGFLNSLVGYSSGSQFMVILVLFPAAGFLLWVVVDNWERITKNLQDTYDQTLIGWGQALEYRDRETEGHSQRVAEMTVALARRLGVPGEKLDPIRRGALLHDLGKMAVPDAILLKKVGLSEAERQIVRMHPLHARKLLENNPYLKKALEIPYSHHERWDGTGYPEGLSKNAIPFSARIFAVVDVWDALVSDRPYRPAWPERKARKYIRDQSGKLFDPEVVGAFMEYLEGADNRAATAGCAGKAAGPITKEKPRGR